MVNGLTLWSGRNDCQE